MAKEKGCTPSQLALAWVLSRGDNVFPLFGTTRISSLQENIQAVNLKLTEDDLNRIDGFLKTFTPAGDIYDRYAK